jgi:hypothetical protein
VGDVAHQVIQSLVVAKALVSAAEDASRLQRIVSRCMRPCSRYVFDMSGMQGYEHSSVEIVP